MSTLICHDEQRRQYVHQYKLLIGLDYLEVGQTDKNKPGVGDQQVLTVYFLGKAPVKLDKTQVRIEGGQRIRDIQVCDVKVCRSEHVEFDDYMTVVVDKPGDFSTYTLRVVERNEQDEWQPHSQFDPRYDRIEFSFKVDGPSELDCKQEQVCPPEQRDEPDINYLAKDYASFRQLILDRLALVMPDWQERHVPDIGIALVEVMAYAGDHLSYYQDAVATEAYLDTARKRISIRRHARLVDYVMHEGCNARTWICIQVSNNPPPINPKDILFITGLNNTFQNAEAVITNEDLQKYPASQYEVFQPISKDEIQLYKDHNRIQFYIWSNQLCCLPRGSTSATLLGKWVPPEKDDDRPHCDPIDDSNTLPKQKCKPALEDKIFVLSKAELHLKVDDILIFEEVMGPETGFAQDANPKYRHAVRLTSISSDIDPLNCQPITHITWHDEDALPFPLCLSVLGPAPECKLLENVSVACGNVVLVDHGRSANEDLGEVPQGDVTVCCKGEGMVADSVSVAGSYNPSLKYAPLTFCEPLQADKPASEMLAQSVHRAIPKLWLTSMIKEVDELQWEPKQDLLGSHADDRHFVAEMDNEGRAYLRFGNNEMGRRPQVGMSFNAEYRIGNGLTGNVGANTISHVVIAAGLSSTLSAVNSVRNPLSAQGGTAPEPVADVKLFAAHTFRKELQRAIIADDYAAIVLREFKSKVQNAAAKLRWNGSWYEVLVAVDAYGQEQADQALLDEISGRLHRYRRMGHDLVVKSARRVALDIGLEICVLPNYLKGHVKAELLKIFSNKRLTNGNLGFFHPDNLTFGEDIYLSKLVAAAQSVEGIESVVVNKMQRWCELENNEIADGKLPLAPFEIARLDNDPNFQENGKLTLDMRGGR